MKDSTKRILKKYDFKVPDLILHYIAICGELPSSVIIDFGLSSDLKKYYISRSKLLGGKGYLLNKNSNGLYGYQLSIKGVRYLLSKQKKYEVYLKSNQDVRHSTNDLLKRLRYRRSAYLYYFLDKADIEYFRNSLTFFPYCFYGAKIIKNAFSLKNETKPHKTEFEFVSSKAFGLLHLKALNYIVYVFDDSVSSLFYNIELRAKVILENIYDFDNMGIMFFFNSYDTLSKNLHCILDIIVNQKDVSDKKQYKFFKKIEPYDYSEIVFCSLDDYGIKQLSYIKNKDELINKAVAVLKALNNEIVISETNDTLALNDTQIFIICHFDILKIINVYNRVALGKGGYYKHYIIFCFEHQKDLMNKIFQPFTDVITIKTIDNLLK